MLLAKKMENLIIDNFIQVDVSVKGQSLRVESSGDKGLPTFFSSGLSILSSPDAHGLRSYEDVFSLRVGDVIKINSVAANYTIAVSCTVHPFLVNKCLIINVYRDQKGHTSQETDILRMYMLSIILKDLILLGLSLSSE